MVTIEDNGEAIVIRKAKNFLALEGMLGPAALEDEERGAAMQGAAGHALGDD